MSPVIPISKTYYVKTPHGADVEVLTHRGVIIAAYLPKEAYAADGHAAIMAVKEANKSLRLHSKSETWVETLARSHARGRRFVMAHAPERNAYKARITIRTHKSGGYAAGYNVSGTDTHGRRVRIHTMTKDGAEAIKKAIQVDNQEAISMILKARG